jgi:hypothetical protein
MEQRKRRKKVACDERKNAEAIFLLKLDGKLAKNDFRDFTSAIKVR